MLFSPLSSPLLVCESSHLPASAVIHLVWKHPEVEGQQDGLETHGVSWYLLHHASPLYEPLGCSNIQGELRGGSQSISQKVCRRYMFIAWFKFKSNVPVFAEAAFAVNATYAGSIGNCLYILHTSLDTDWISPRGKNALPVYFQMCCKDCVSILDWKYFENTCDEIPAAIFPLTCGSLLPF